MPQAANEPEVHQGRLEVFSEEARRRALEFLAANNWPYGYQPYHGSPGVMLGEFSLRVSAEQYDHLLEFMSEQSPPGEGWNFPLDG